MTTDSHPIFRLEQAQALPEFPQDDYADMADDKASAIKSFKDANGKTMNVVSVDGVLYKQEAGSPE